ncbi:hypothetical protein QN367_11215 [Cryobacterium sp. RTS3]|uniref:hypothetical protein n=1 Tax=Cryobacterium sp. RTS3 TaxID=3048643 RepID=UPI002B228177|nr:hypothetical protein [Cryobacterium sp. RTS3]MEA9999671.1 hypothetical protein [Cryobacterium sp. RTS3]
MDGLDRLSDIFEVSSGLTEAQEWENEEDHNLSGESEICIQGQVPSRTKAGGKSNSQTDGAPNCFDRHERDPQRAGEGLLSFLLTPHSWDFGGVKLSIATVVVTSGYGVSL